MSELSLVKHGTNLTGLLASDRRYIADIEEGIPFTVLFSHSSFPARIDGLIFSFYRRVAEQLGDTTEKEVEQYCRLSLGVMLLRAQTESFDKHWTDLYEGRHDYEEQLRLVLGIKVVEIMTAKQKITYLQMIRDQYAEADVSLVLPDWVPVL